MGTDKLFHKKDESKTEEDDRGILFFQDERGKSEEETAPIIPFGAGQTMKEIERISPLEAVKRSVMRTAEEIKQSDAESKAEEKPEEVSPKPSRKKKKESTLLAKCMPFIYDEEGVNYAEEKPDYTLESVEDIIESAERRADERIARMYNLKTSEVSHIGGKKPAEEKPQTATLKSAKTSIRKGTKIGDEVFTAAKLFETAPIPKVSETLFDDLTARRTDVVGKENVITVYSAQGGMESQEGGFTKAIPELNLETDSTERYEDILSHTRPVNVEDISSSSEKSSNEVSSVTSSITLDDIEEEVIVDDFKGEKDVTRIGSMLKGAAFFSKLRFLSTALLTAFAGILLIDGVQSNFGAATLSILEAALFGIALMINGGIFSAFKDVFKKKSRVELPLAVAMLLCTIYFVLGIILAQYPSSVAFLPLVSLLFYTYLSHKTAAATFKAFRLVAVRKPKTAVALLDDPAVTTPMARSMNAGEVVIAGQQSADEILDFVKNSSRVNALSGKAGIFTLIFMISAAFIGLAAGVGGGGIMAGLYGAVVVLLLAAAPTLFVAELLPFVSASAHLYDYRAAVCSAVSAEKIEDASAVVVASCDLFPEGSIKLYNMTPLSANELDETLVLAAAVAENIKSPLAGVFKKILTEDTLLPEADTVKYEDTLGVSGWVGDEHILIGNRSLMIAHGVRVPALEVDKKMLRQGYFPVYVAVNQRACALLTVGYMVDRYVMKKLGRLQDKGVTLLVDNCDPNITEQMLCDYFDFYFDLVKILDFGGVHKYKKATEPVKNASAHGFHRADSESFIELVLSCFKMKLSKKVLEIIHVFTAVICVAAFAVLTLGSGGLVSVNLCLLGELISLVIALTAHFALK